jgi:hypothetical protein
VDLNDWITSRPGDDPVSVAAELLGETPRTVRSWIYGERRPSYRAAKNIVLKSNLAVDFNGIYAPFMRRDEVDRGRV